MKRKLLALDIDGTSVCDDYSMGIKSKEAIKLAQREGYVVAFVTGRREIDMRTIEDDQWVVDYQVLNTGSKIIRCADKKVIYNKVIPSETCEKLISYSLKKDVQLQWSNGLQWYVTKMAASTEEYARDINLIPIVIESLDQFEMNESIESFMAGGEWKYIADYIDAFLPELSYANSEPGSIDIMPRNVSKWKGIEKLAAQLDINYRDIITVGNYYNDIDMLKRANIGIAVNNSADEVKKVADYITERDNNHDVIEEIVNKLLKNEYDTTR